MLPPDVRAKRAKETILALAYLFGGAKQTQHLTDDAPKFVILAIVRGGNHLFMNLAHEKNGKVEFNYQGLKQTLIDYSDVILSDVYVGIMPGFLDGLVGKFRAEFGEFRLFQFLHPVKVPTQSSLAMSSSTKISTPAP